MYRSHRAGASHPAGGPALAGHESLEEDNLLREDELKGKVNALKSLSIDIGSEVREHNRYLRDVDDTFDSASGVLGQSIQRVYQLARSGSRYHLLYLFLFCLFVFLILWWRL